MKFKILVTGAGGYLGNILCPKLAQAGHHIIALDTVPTDFSGTGKIETVTGSCTDTALIQKWVSRVDVLIPLAALVGAPLCDKNPELAKQVNYQAVKTLNEARSKNQLVIFPMTNNGYTPIQGKDFADETVPFKTDSLYTLTKFQAEQALLSKGNAISLRLASAFGISPAMRWDLLIHNYTRAAFTENHLSIFEPHFKRSFVHVEDIASAFEHSIQNSSLMSGQVFNVALPSGNISKLELAEKIKQRVPELSIEIDNASKDPDARNVYISTEKIKKTGFEAKRTIDEGIIEILSHCSGQTPVEAGTR